MTSLRATCRRHLLGVPFRKRDPPFFPLQTHTERERDSEREIESVRCIYVCLFCSVIVRVRAQMHRAGSLGPTDLSDDTRRLASLQLLLIALPAPNRDLLQALFSFLRKVRPACALSARCSHQRSHP
jgi:hypothetical protein